MGKEKSKKEKDKSKSRKEKKEKKHRKHRRRSSSDSSDSDGDFEGAEQRLARERAAVGKLRDILSSYPAVRKELREMLWRVDQGEAANISSVPDPELKYNLGQLLELLRLRRNDKGIYGLIERSEKILPIVGFVFDEPPRPRPQLAQDGRRPSDPATTAVETDGAGSSLPGKPKSASQAELSRHMGPIGHTRLEPADAVANVVTDEDEDEGAKVPVRTKGSSEISPLDISAARAQEDVCQEGTAAAASTTVAEAPVAAPGPRRVAGPAMPPRELLEAAAMAAEALRAAGPSFEDGSDGDDGLLVGPPPPELVEELDAAPQDEREAEVIRIIKVLREHNAAAAQPKSHLELMAGPDAHGATADAYSVLGVSPSASAGDVKKRYMRLSLLIHPDKCNHPLAHEAFQAVATSAKVLQDSGLRSALDERLADADLRRRAEEMAAEQERKRAWRVVRGEEAPDSTGPMGPSGAQRESWMTELPPEMAAGQGAAGLSQTSVRAFSQRGKTGRGDTSGWTDNPEQRKAREAQALLAAASQAYMQALPAAGSCGGSSTAAVMDSFNASSRKKSLMEVHLELQEKSKEEARAAKKVAKKQKTDNTVSQAGVGGGGTGGAADAAGGQDWPWRPFDRERDLEIKPRAKSGADIVKSAAALGSKFSGGGTQRHFL